MQFAPFAQAQEAEEVLVRPLAQLRLGQLLVRLAIGLPELEDADKLGFGVRELRMGVVGRRARVGGALARVLDAEEAGDDQHLVQAAMPLRGHQHAGELHVDRQPRHAATDRGELALLVDGPQLGQLLPAVGDGARIGWFEKWKRLDAAQPQRQHAQDHARKRGAADLRIGVGRARGEIAFGIQPVAGARRDAPAAPLALVGAGLADRFDVQAIELLPRTVALDPRQPRVHHVMDARHGERGLGHVGGQHDPSLRARVEDAILVARG